MACRFGDQRGSDLCPLSWEGGKLPGVGRPTGHPWALGKETWLSGGAAVHGGPGSDLLDIS